MTINGILPDDSVRTVDDTFNFLPNIVPDFILKDMGAFPGANELNLNMIVYGLIIATIGVCIPRMAIRSAVVFLGAAVFGYGVMLLLLPEIGPITALLFGAIIGGVIAFSVNPSGKNRRPKFGGIIITVLAIAGLLLFVYARENPGALGGLLGGIHT